MDKFRNWLFENEDEIDYQENTITLKQYMISNQKTFNEAGQSFKENNIILCYLDEKHLERELDYFNGISFILNYKHITLTKRIHLFIPECVNYKFIE